eukprot:CAMPEP_0194542140 /NCGR_PEP_ID=MMETSP0253-20130528/83502_1 /TAXON_ID=2966 /ORGANISM="Noctiluca scintillans" /LENGTH=78 /DNA_ID=CAMNT_0039388727 /DNA_START=15 /DNA_END=248 /DNA_ORIENTATION=-
MPLARGALPRFGVRHIEHQTTASSNPKDWPTRDSWFNTSAVVAPLPRDPMVLPVKLEARPDGYQKTSTRRGSLFDTSE